MYDKIGFRIIYKIVIATELLVCSLMPYIVKSNKYLYLVWVLISFLCYGAHFVIFPGAIISIFGLKSSVQLSSFIYFTRCLAALGGMFI